MDLATDFIVDWVQRCSSKFKGRRLNVNPTRVVFYKWVIQNRTIDIMNDPGTIFRVTYTPCPISHA